ncbi:MAG: hypothetical protein R3181_08670 [Rubricoccaceae bacterium]|nr:hypothetical protein [Rubricoccaceae bacterium]
MRFFFLQIAALVVAAVVLTSAPASAQEPLAGASCAHPEDAPPSFVHPLFPDHGTLNALVLFVQHRDDDFEDCRDRTQVLYDDDGQPYHPQIDDDAICYAGPDGPAATSWTDDEATEWPAYWRDEPGRPLPLYVSDGWLAPPDATENDYVEGSLSQYYHLNSGGEFKLHGYVYPEVYVPEHDRDWYLANPQPFENGGLRLSHEILRSAGVQAFVNAIPNAAQVFDRYRNGTNLTVGDIGEDARDGLFDMIVMVFRSNQPCRVGVFLDDGVCTEPTASGVASLGTDYPPWRRAEYNGFAPDPLYLGGLEVVDNHETGSGVWSAGGDARTAVTLTAHEIGHRQLYYNHSDENSYSVMVGSGAHRLGMFGAAERLNLGWATAVELDLDALADPITPLTLGDTFETGEVLLVKEGSEDLMTLFQARTHGNVWDRPPDGTNADGDIVDLHLPEPGLLASRVHRSSSGSFTHYWNQSLENHGLPTRTCFFDGGDEQQCALGGLYPFAFSPGDAFTPLSHVPLRLTRNEGLDDRLAVTDITPEGSGFSFDLWRDFLVSHAAPKRVQTNYTLSRESLARTDEWTFGGDLTFDDGFEAPPLDNPLDDPSITLLPSARMIVPAGVDATLRGEPGDPFPFTAGAGARLRIAGESLLGRYYDLPSFRAEHVRFSAADASGWHGINVSGARARLYDSRVEGVVWTTAQLRNAALAAYDADLILDDGSRILGAENAHGLLAVGGTVTVKGQSQVFENDGVGVVASGGAAVTLEEPGTEVALNGLGGVVATGYGSAAVLDQVSVVRNFGPGVHATAGASIDFVPSAVLGERVVVDDNGGGVSATDNGVVRAGMCATAQCDHAPHSIADNAPGGAHFDARSLTGATLFAEGNYWGEHVQSIDDLVLVGLGDPSSFLSVEPIATTPGARVGPSLGDALARIAGGAHARGAGEAAVALIAEAERALDDGDTAAASALVVEALTGVAADTAATEADHRAAFGGAGRFLTLAQPADVVGWLGDRAAEGGALRPWALRTLTVAWASAGEEAEAETTAEALVAEHPADEHGRMGHGALVRLATAAADEAGALGHLEAMAGAFPDAEATVEAASVVAAAFPEADVEGVLNGAGGRVAGPVAEAVPAAVAVPASFLVADVRPNPSGAGREQAVLPVTLSAEAYVEAVVYDARGRRLGLVHANRLGAGAHALPLGTWSLPSGVYVVHVTARDGAGPRVAVRRFTVVR